MLQEKSPYPPDKYIIALTGGIASGKSVVAEILRKLGAGIVDTDLIARKVVKPGSPVLTKIHKTWGDSVFNSDGTLNRAKLASIIFSSESDRKKLNSFIHPEIRKIMIKDVKKCMQRVVVIVIPLLFEAEVPIYYDESWLVYCTPFQQKERLMHRDGILDEDAQKRIDSQIPIDEKAKKADVIISNTQDLEATYQDVEKTWHKLKERLEN